MSESAQPVTAFISWAHSHRSWAADRSRHWRQTVLDFATALRQIGGVDADIDLWHTASHEDWSTFGVAGIRNSDFVLIVVSQAYRERWEATGSPSEGAGAAREANAIKSIFERDRDEFLRRIKVVLLPSATIDDIPMELLASTERFRIRTFDLAGLTPLLRSIHGKPDVPKPALGGVPALPPSYVADVSASRTQEGDAPARRAATDRDALERRLGEIDETLSRPDEAPGAPEWWKRESLVEEREVIAGSLAALNRVASDSGVGASPVLADQSTTDELAEAIEAAKEAIGEARQAMRLLPPIACEALFQYFHNAQALTVGGTLDRFSVEDAIRSEEEGYLNWVEDVEQTVSARQAHPRVGAAADALQRVRSVAFGGVSWESRAQAPPWARAMLHEEYGVDDPEFELRPVWVQLGFI